MKVNNNELEFATDMLNNLLDEEDFKLFWEVDLTKKSFGSFEVEGILIPVLPSLEAEDCLL